VSGYLIAVFGVLAVLLVGEVYSAYIGPRLEARRRNREERVSGLADALDKLNEPKARRFDPNSNAVGVQTPYGPISRYASGKSNVAAAVPWTNGTTSAQP